MTSKESTIEYIKNNATGLLKRAGKDSLYLFWNMNKVSQVDKELFEHLIIEYYMKVKDPKNYLIVNLEENEFITFYASADEIIDDGWQTYEVTCD